MYPAGLNLGGKEDSEGGRQSSTWCVRPQGFQPDTLTQPPRLSACWGFPLSKANV